MINENENRPQDEVEVTGQNGKLAMIQHRLHEIIFEADTPLGKLFDALLLIAIVASVILVCLESVISSDPTPEQERWAVWLIAAEWVFTILFTIEYALRIIAVQRPLRYIFSFFGIVDLLAFLPTYIAYFFFSQTHSSLAVIRAFRLLRVFRVFKLLWLMSEADELWQAIWLSRGKIVVFMGVVFIAVAIVGAAMYEIEGPNDPYDSIPISMYWATVTMTTVGYGDIIPSTTAGKALATCLILLGYSLIIVPTGFVSAEFVAGKSRKKITTQACPHCMREGHDIDARHCKYCGNPLNPVSG